MKKNSTFFVFPVCKSLPENKKPTSTKLAGFSLVVLRESHHLVYPNTVPSIVIVPSPLSATETERTGVDMP